MVKVHFIGAGPGDPELITVKAKKVIENADVIIYADSLVNPEICSFARKNAAIHKSAGLTLEETTGIIVKAVNLGKKVVRIQSGDPSIYGAIAEQMALLDEKGIKYEIIPGVSSLFAAAALLQVELTAPEVSQTVIVTRREGRTPVPARENLPGLAAHNATIALFLSVSQAADIVADLMKGGYGPGTPAAVVYRAGWKDQKIIRTTLKYLAQRIKENKIEKQALILVGKSLAKKRPQIRSKLYDPDFKHGCRE
jgi:precorrin-4/cobalt-precorrin-4 C11-methyltransferase